MRNTYDWTNGKLQFRNSSGDAELSSKDIPEVLTPWFFEYGVKQWLGSYLAKAANGTPAEYLRVAREALERLRTGDIGGRRARTLDTIVGRAYQIIAQRLGKGDDSAAAWMQEYLDSDEARRETIRAKPHMKAAIAEARTERAIPEPSDDEFDPNA